MAAGTFRQDLYFRLARYIVATPPLRERIEDVPLLAAHYLKIFAAEMGQHPPVLGREALAVLKAYGFPGNIRELKNIIERALIESGGGGIQPAHLQLHRPAGGSALPSVARDSPAERAAALPLNLAEAEDVLIQRAL